MIHYIVNFALFVVLMRYLYRTKVSTLLVEHSASIKKHIDKASLDLARAQEKLSIASSRFRDIEAEKKELIEQYVSEGDRMSDTIGEQADASVARLAADTRRQVEMEYNQARKELRRQAIGLAAAQARKQLESGLSQDEDRRLRSQVLREALLTETNTR